MNKEINKFWDKAEKGKLNLKEMEEYEKEQARKDIKKREVLK